MDARRPKRRRDKDNPYTLSCRDGRCYITFKDGQSVDQCIEISEVQISGFHPLDPTAAPDSGFLYQCGDPVLSHGSCAGRKPGTGRDTEG